MKGQKVKTDHCLNCNSSLQDENFCPNCGQLNDSRKPTFLELMSDFFANLISFDSKFYRTLIPLIKNPGFVSQEFYNGKRNYYASPVRMFLLTTFFMLFIGAIETNKTQNKSNLVNFTVNNEEVNDENIRIDSLASNFTTPYNEYPQNPSEERLTERISRMYDLVRSQDSLSMENSFKLLKIENTFINRLIYSNILKVKNLTIDQYYEYFRSKLVIILLLFIPFLAAMLKLLYFKAKEFYFIDHFIFSIHELTVFFIILILRDISGLITTSIIPDIILNILFIIHIWLAMRKFYGQGKVITALKLLILSLGFVLVSIIFLILSGITTFIMM